MRDVVKCRTTTPLAPDTNCTTASLIPTVNGNTVCSFEQLSAAQGRSTTVSRSTSNQHFDSSAHGLVRRGRSSLFPYQLITPSAVSLWQTLRLSRTRGGFVQRREVTHEWVPPTVVDLAQHVPVRVSVQHHVHLAPAHPQSVDQQSACVSLRLPLHTGVHFKSPSPHLAGRCAAIGGAQHVQLGHVGAGGVELFNPPVVLAAALVERGEPRRLSPAPASEWSCRKAAGTIIIKGAESVQLSHAQTLV